jgi:phosphoglycolate phosphatase-like HAD superfamily hydrolase
MSNGRGVLLFDIDGTLMVSRGRGLRAMHHTFQNVFDRQPHPAAILPHGKTDPLLFGEMARAYGVSEALLGERLEHVHVVYAAELERLLREPGCIELKPGIPALLDRLARRPGVRLGLVSGNLARTAWLKLEAAGLAAFFAGGAFGSDAPERFEIVGRALERFGVRSPRSAWVIGDTPDDVASGRAQGTRTLAVATGRHDVEVLRRCQPDAVLEDFANVERVVDILCDAT